jgi:hypothetical protein
MADIPLVKRVEKLEKTLESLADIPRRMTVVEERLGGLESRVGSLDGRVGSLELQIVQLRSEMRDGFSAVRQEAATMRSDLLQVFDAGSRATEALFKETWAQMRTLHEDVTSRIARLGEARPGVNDAAP